MAVNYGPLEQRIVEAINMCEKKDAPTYPQALLEYAENTIESGLKTSEVVVLPDGHEVKRSIRERHQPKRFTPLV
jgi:hypothetical protein